MKTMTDHVYADWITEDELQSLLASPPAALDWMILEAVDEVVNLQAFQSKIDIKRFATGRVFGAMCEIRWQRDGQRFHTMMTGDVATPPNCLTKHHQELGDDTYVKSPPDLEYYVWGEWNKDLWVEAQIPHIFDYPTPSEPGHYRYKLAVTEYTNLKTGEMEFYRFTGTREELI
jgi:hypothetical protein